MRGANLSGDFLGNWCPRVSRLASRVLFGTSAKEALTACLCLILAELRHLPGEPRRCSQSKRATRLRHSPTLFCRQKRQQWWARQDSNPRPSRYERPALTAELQARCRCVNDAHRRRCGQDRSGSRPLACMARLGKGNARHDIRNARRLNVSLRQMRENRPPPVVKAGQIRLVAHIRGEAGRE